MGNAPSQPSPLPSPPVQSPPPPLPPPCDPECQKQKDLTVLKQKLDSIDPEADPSGYEQARIAYFTLLNGPGWLAQEKQRIAKEDVQPVLSSFRQQFNALKGEQQSQGIFQNLANALKAQEGADEQSNAFLKKQLTAEKDKATTSDRLVQLGGPQEPSQWISWLMDVIITLLGLFVLYKLYRVIMARFVSTTPAVLTST